MDLPQDDIPDTPAQRARDRRRVLRAFNVSLAAVLVLTVIFFSQSGFDFRAFTVMPHDPAGLLGVLTAPLLHGDLKHLAMNGMWFWELGRRIEWRQGSLVLLALTLLFSLVSNLAQYLFGGPAIFGGLSGVLYGLLGHCWLFQRLAPCTHYRLPPGVIGMMLVWLLVCLSGLIGALGFGAIANAAHVGGLLAGCLSGLLGGLLARRR